MVVTQVCLDAAKAAKSPKSPQSALPELPFRSTVPTGFFAGISPQPAIGMIDLEGECAFLRIASLSRVRFSVPQHIWEKVMKYIAILSMAALLMASESARAGQVLGPFPDGDLLIQPDPSLALTKVYATRWTGHTSSGQTIGGRDILIINEAARASDTPIIDPNHIGTVPLPVPPCDPTLAISHLFVTLHDVPIREPGVPKNWATITTIYGEKLSDGSVTGFTHPADFQPVGGETHIGNSGNEYHSYFSQQISGIDLATSLVGYDLSSFDLGTTAPYQVFQTEVPTFEINAVPEPSALALLLVGISGLACVRLKAKRPKSL